jgi:hypothetical protein
MSFEPNYHRGIIGDCLAWVDGAGTGFFIARDLLLTCTHVIGNKTTVTVKPWLPGGTMQATVLPGALPADDGDLALLQVTEPNPKQDAVLLHTLGPEEFVDSRDVVLAGYPRDDRQQAGGYEPIPATVRPRWADRTTLGGLIIDTAADVPRGLSGAPVLDLATGTVIGIARYRKGTLNDPGGGGGAIPVALAVQAFPQVRAVYDRPPEAVERWLNGLDDYELRIIGRERRGTTGRIDLRLSGKLDQWSVDVDDENSSQSETIQLNALGGVNVTKAVFQWTRGHRTPSSDDLQLVGEILSAALLHGRVGDLYRKWCGAAAELTVRLMMADPVCELADLPWEYAQPSSEGGRSLGLDTKLALARVMPGVVWPRPPLEAGRQASVIALIVQPDSANLSYPSVITTEHDAILWPSISRLEEDIAKAAEGLDLRPVITNPSRMRLEQLTGSCDVLHYQGFARITPSACQLFLHSEMTTRRLIPVDVNDVAAVAGRLRAKVVVIEAHAAPASEFSRDDPALRIAAPFLKAGAIAVLTTRFPVHPDQALLFNQEFYKSLKAGLTIERAAQAGRLSVSFDNTLPDPAAYGAFVLWTADVPGLRVVLPWPADATDDRQSSSGPPTGAGSPAAAQTYTTMTPRDSGAISGG